MIFELGYCFEYWSQTSTGDVKNSFGFWSDWKPVLCCTWFQFCELIAMGVDKAIHVVTDERIDQGVWWHLWYNFKQFMLSFWLLISPCILDGTTDNSKGLQIDYGKGGTRFRYCDEY